MKFCFYHGFLLKNHLLRAYYLGFDLSGWIVLIKSEILTTTGMVWLVSSDKWKVPLEMKFRWIKGRIRERKGCSQKSLDKKLVLHRNQELHTKFSSTWQNAKLICLPNIYYDTHHLIWNTTSTDIVLFPSDWYVTVPGFPRAIKPSAAVFQQKVEDILT